MTTYTTNCGCLASTPPDRSDPVWADHTAEEFDQAHRQWAAKWELTAGAHEAVCPASPHYIVRKMPRNSRIFNPFTLPH